MRPTQTQINLGQIEFYQYGTIVIIHVTDTFVKMTIGRTEKAIYECIG